MRLKVPNESFFSKINTLRFRISILYVAVIGLILILLQGILYFNYTHSMSQEFDAQLQMKAEQLGGLLILLEKCWTGSSRRSLWLPKKH